MAPSGCPVTPGFPIRKSPDQSMFDCSPGHIAAYHVLHRLSTPRHPPCTLNSLTTLMRGCHRHAEPTPRHPTTYTHAGQATYRRKTSPTRFNPSIAHVGNGRSTAWNLWLYIHTHRAQPESSSGAASGLPPGFRLNSASTSSVAKKPGKARPEGGAMPAVGANHAFYRPCQCCQDGPWSFFDPRIPWG